MTVSARLPSLSGTVRVPGDKSIAHRALILAALADGESWIEGLPDGLDVKATRACLTRLGTRFDDDQGALRTVPSERWREGETLDAGNSGTTARLLAGALAARGCTATIVGDASLSRRPMERAAAPLRQLGANVELESGRLPARVTGAPLTAATWSAEVASAQVKSAFLLAALGARGESVYREAVATRDHLERMLPTFGVGVALHGGEARVCGPAHVQPGRVSVPGDPSSAAFLLTAAVLLPRSEVRVEGVLLNPLRTAFAGVLARAGADVTIEPDAMQAGPEPVGTLVARSSSLRALSVEADDVPRLVDELPLLVLAAAFAKGESRFAGLDELRHKESDRLAALTDLLTGLGVPHALVGDDLLVTGGGNVRECSFDARGDHRLAMLRHVVALLVPGMDAPPDPCIDASWPAFPAALADLRA